MKPRMNTGKLLAIGAAFTVVLTVAISIWLDPPADNRARAMDGERVNRLQFARSAIADYFVQHKALPSNIDALESYRGPLGNKIWHDPVTGQTFEYEITGEKSYRLCVNFERKAENGVSYYFTDHKAGRDCFDYNVK